MFAIGNFIIALSRVVDLLLTALWWLILIRALVSWVSPSPYNPIVQFLYRTTEPILEPIRRFLPMRGIDFSPLVAFLIIMFLRAFLVTTLYDLGVRLRFM